MKSFKILNKEFKRIKNMGLIEPLRKGSTGIGYTFETLLNKTEDAKCEPDFLGIELKTKLGYSKTPMTLFHCAPKRKNINAINYIFEKYSYKKYNDKNCHIFAKEVYSKKTIKIYNYEFKLFVDYLGKEIVMKAYYNNEFIEDVCFWDFKTLQLKLIKKMKNLAIIHAYPYKIKNKLYYKYLKISSYKLKGFFEFLQLIEHDKIHIQFYLKKNGKNEKIVNHGTSFRINNDSIEQLFTKIKL